jgi:phage gp36-like protein
MSLPTVPTNLYTDRAGVELILGVCGVNLRINDSETTVVSADEENYLNYLIYTASQEIDMYLSNRYDPSVMLQSWLVRNWCSIIAAYRVAMRRCGSPPVALQWEYEQTMDKLGLIQVGQLEIGGLASLATPGVAMSNLRMDPRAITKRMRVEVPISGQQPNNQRPVIKDIQTSYFPDSNG